MEKTTGSNNEETIREIFNKWGTYQSLQKDLAIIRFFMNNPDTKIRQKKVIECFRNEMSPKTCREHLYRLCKRGILHEDEEFKGTYTFSSKPIPGEYQVLIQNMKDLIKAIVGHRIYELAISELKDKYKAVIKDLDHQLEECREELRRIHELYPTISI